MIREKIQADLMNALKSGDAKKRSVLGMLNAAIKNKELQKRQVLSKQESDQSKLQELSTLDEQELLAVISAEVKKRKESITQFQNADRSDLVQNEKAELEILTAYLPTQISDEELGTVIDAVIKEIGAKSLKDMGKVMSATVQQCRGKAEGSRISSLVKQKLSG